jgi:hypothetical protein
MITPEEFKKWEVILKKIQESPKFELDLSCFPSHFSCEESALRSLFDWLVEKDPNFNSESQNTINWAWHAFQTGFKVGVIASSKRGDQE